jgi:hypothetical protein
MNGMVGLVNYKSGTIIGCIQAHKDSIESVLFLEKY